MIYSKRTGVKDVFQKQIGNSILEVSHKLIERPNKSVYFNHIHNHCEMLLFISGEADYNIDGKIFTPSPYDLLFVPAATYHYLIPTASVPYENYVIGVDPSFIDESHYEKLFSPPLMISVKDDRELMGYFSRLDYYSANYSKADFDLCAAALIRELITYCGYRKDELNSAHSGSLALIEEMIKFISDNIEKPLDAETVARRFSLSKSYVQNIFSQNMHIGLKKYIIQKKIYAAHSDIVRGENPGSVCEKYSFGDYSVFYRTYKNTFGVSPKAYVKKS